MTMLTTEQLAAHLGISARQVQRLAAAGLPSIPVGARARRYDPDACEQWLQANREALCPSTPRQPAAGKSLSASAASAFTDACRRVRLRVTPSV
ncbi:MAG: helix-turn-helix domain-containing protein [Betaproteobacteria bacterium]|nr:helix-turn-helix domain-containing protein [Betaproteobacteria bacterium]